MFQQQLLLHVSATIPAVISYYTYKHPEEALYNKQPELKQDLTFKRFRKIMKSDY